MPYKCCFCGWFARSKYKCVVKSRGKLYSLCEECITVVSEVWEPREDANGEHSGAKRRRLDSSSDGVKPNSGCQSGACGGRLDQHAT